MSVITRTSGWKWRMPRRWAPRRRGKTVTIYPKLSGTESRDHDGDPEYNAWNRRHPGVRLPGRGLLLRQRLECPAIPGQRVRPAHDLLQRCSTRRLPPSWRDLPVSIVIPRIHQRDERLGDILDHQDKLD